MDLQEAIYYCLMDRIKRNNGIDVKGNSKNDKVVLMYVVQI